MNCGEAFSFPLPLLPIRYLKEEGEGGPEREGVGRRRRRREGEGGDQFQYSAANNPRTSFTLIPSA
jgi:hypothetical protein